MNMQAITTVRGLSMPLPIKDIDTDMIIPAQYLTSISQANFGQYLFDRLKKQDPQFPTNLERYQNAAILIARDNFGCGSSREHAVWALMDAGFKAVIAPSFADIFSTNCGKNGLLTICLSEATVEDLLMRAQAQDLVLSIDLENLSISDEQNWSATFPYDSFQKFCLTRGLDNLDYLLQHREQIDNYFLNNPAPTFKTN